jgi:hypothetical protein
LVDAWVVDTRALGGAEYAVYAHCAAFIESDCPPTIAVRLTARGVAVAFHASRADKHPLTSEAACRFVPVSLAGVQ